LDAIGFEYANDRWEHTDADDKKSYGIGEMIMKGFSRREIEVTPDNPDSSRSAVVVYVRLNFKPADGQEPADARVPFVHIIISEMPGVELMQCDYDSLA